MGSRRVFRSVEAFRWSEHVERCKAAVGHMVHVHHGQSTRIAVKLMAVGRTLATVQYPPDPEPQQVGLDQVEGS
jgi:hypothetical protein